MSLIPSTPTTTPTPTLACVNVRVLCWVPSVLGTTTVAPDGKDLLVAPAAPNPMAVFNHLGAAATTAPPAPQASAAPSAPPLDVSGATPVVVLANMLTPEESANDSEMSEILVSGDACAARRDRTTAQGRVAPSCTGTGGPRWRGALSRATDGDARRRTPSSSARSMARW